MAKIKVKGKAGAAKNYTTRSAAVKKLQCSLADFRRLCILKGIFPREPRNKKKANKGSSAPTSFYYTKDIAYLAHEPILKKLREHKAFAKKLSRALGRGEWANAKSLEDNKPIYRLDHIIKERYPTFIDALRDIDDALCMVFLFASLPSDSRLSPELLSNCTRLASEWQLFVLHSKSLRKVFLSIKGVYYQAEVMDQKITWLVPYQFTQNVPQDVDMRVMMTFLELYQTLLSFVFFKLYTDVGLAYPPPLDTQKDDAGAGINALSLNSLSETPVSAPQPKTPAIAVDGRQITGKDVRQTIKSIGAATGNVDDTEMAPPDSEVAAEVEEDFVEQPSKDKTTVALPLPTLRTLSSLPQSSLSTLFAPYTFFLSRETSRSVFEFLVRSFGGRLGWPASSGAGSPYDESDPSITHVIIDRPVVVREETPAQKELRARRKYVQPQWVVDCINAGKILLEEPYAQGKTLPPHLSPFGEGEGAYIPDLGERTEDIEVDEDAEAEEDAESGNEQEDEPTVDKAVMEGIEDEGTLRAAELAAEAAGMDYDAFEEKVKKAKTKKTSAKESAGDVNKEEEMNKMLMSNKQRKLYDKMKYSQRKKETERVKLEQRRKALSRGG